MDWIQNLDLIQTMNFILNNFGLNSATEIFKQIFDISIVSFGIYKIVTILRDTRAWQLIKGILFILVAAKASGYFGFRTIAYLLDNAVQYIAIALVVIFQPELRRGLEQIGRSRFNSIIFDESENQNQCSTLVEEIIIASEKLSSTKTGALIVFEKKTRIGDIINSGVVMDANITSQLLLNIFSPNTPLHDGAVIIRANKIKSAACFLPLTDNTTNLSKELGTRHRAAIGITEVSDCFSLIISEETGRISIANDGKIQKDLTIEKLNKFLCQNLGEDENRKKTLNIWKVKKSETKL